MRKFTTLIVLAILAMGSLMAQAPQKFTYQAVVRNTNNQLLPNTSVGVQVVILENGAGPQGNPIYAERHVATTNANGLVTLNIGEGNVILGNFSTINWRGGVFFLDIGIDPTGGSDYTIWSTQQLLSVPYALFANEAGNGFSGDYNDLTNKPNLAPVATSGNYSDLSNSPQIPQIPQNVSAFQNDAGYITMDSVPSIPTNVSAFYNDVPYLTSFTEQQVLSIRNDTIFLTGGSFVKLPAGFDGNYNSLSNKPNLANVATSGNYNDLSNRPQIPQIPQNVSAFQNDAGYITMDSVPSIPTNVSAFYNDVPYLTSFTEQQVLSIRNDTIFLTGGSFVKLPAGFDGNYNSLTNKPNLAPVATSGSYNDITGKPNLAPVATSGDYNDLSNRPQIPQIPANVSAFNNDAGYITGYTETDPQYNAWNKDYNDLINKPVIPTIPTNVSAFQNDAGYITMGSVPTIPTNVSAFYNDVPYLTSFTEQQVLSIHNDTIFLTGGSFVKLPAGFDGDYNSLTNKPNLFDGNYNSLTNKPNLAPVATSGAYNDLTGKPNLAPVATSGNYNDLSNKPNLANVATSGNYNDLSNRPQIPQIPANVSAFNNDAGYITGYTETDPQYNAWNKDYNDLINKPIIPNAANNATLTIQRNGSTVGTFTADASVNETVNIAVPTTTSELTNNSSFVTADQLTLLIGAINHRMDSLQTVVSSQNAEISTLSHTVDSLRDILTPSSTGCTPWNTSVTNETACAFYVWHGEIYTQSGIYLYGCTNADGTNNMEALNLTIHQPDTTHLRAEACESYSWNNTTYTESGNYYQKLINKNGCDSVIVLHLTIFNGTHNVFTKDTCEYYVWNGQTYTESGIYTYAYTNADGCASVDTLHLTIYHGNHNVIKEIVCESYIWHDTLYTESGIYTYTYENEYGCASVDTLYLTVHYGTHNVESLNACGSYEWHGQTYTESGTYTYAYNNEYGCPSVDTLKVVVVLVDEKSCSLAPCVTDVDGNMYSTVQIGGQCWMRSNLRTTHYADGTAIPTGNISSSDPYYYDSQSNRLDLAIRGYHYNQPAVMHNQSSSTANPSGVQGVCPDGWHVPSENEWQQLITFVGSQVQHVCDNDYIEIAKALASPTGWRNSGNTCQLGNDVNNNLTGFTAFPTGQWQNDMSCWGTDFVCKFWSSTAGRRFTPGTSPQIDGANWYYGFPVRCVYDISACGTEYEGSHNVETDTTCDSYTWHGQTYTESGAYTYPYKNIYGCASEDTLKLTIHHSTHNVDIKNLFGSYTWYDSIYTETGTYTYEYTNEHGCPSVDTLHLTRGYYPCPGTPTVTDHEGNVYNTVQIGNQCWTKENMRCTTSPSTGANILIPGTGGNTSYVSKFARKPNAENGWVAGVTFYGILYNWNAAVDTFNTSFSETGYNNQYSQNAVSVTFSGHRRGICPQGWHVPSDAEWTQLTNYVSSQEQFLCDHNSANIAKALVSPTGWRINSDSCGVGNSSTNNQTGFTAVPSGYYTGTFPKFGYGAGFWSATQREDVNNIVWGRHIFTDNNPTGMTRADDFYKSREYSVRCLKDTFSSDGTECMGTHNVEIKKANNTYTWHGQTYTESGIYTNIYTNEDGCYSVDTLKLTIVFVDEKSCPSTPSVTDIDGNTYSTVQIGEQCWMRSNLRTTRYADGTAVPAGNSAYSETDPYYYDYENCFSLPERGYYYNWPAVMHGQPSSTTNPSEVQGICPDGWHVPSELEWKQMRDYVTSKSEYYCDRFNYFSDASLASNTGWTNRGVQCAPGDNITHNATGFSAMPAGFYQLVGRIGYASYVLNGADCSMGAYFWCSTENSANKAYYQTIPYGSSLNVSKDMGFSVRCVMNAEADSLGYTIDEKSCPGTPSVTDIDGNTYGTVQLGEQCWMRSNLRATRYADGTAVPAGNMNFSKTEPYYYDFSGQGGDGTSQFFPLSKRGYLYNWPAAMHGAASSNTNPSQVQGICPDGWHVPSNEEWTQLENYVKSQSQYSCCTDVFGNNSCFAKALTSTLGWKYCNGSSNCYPGYNPSANNATGFNAMPVGIYAYNGYQSATEVTWFLSSTENDSASIHFCMLWYDGTYLGRFIEPKDKGYSVRCLKNTAASGGDTPCIGTHNVETESSCGNYTWHGQTYTQSGTYTYAYTNDSGCASVDTLHLTVNQPANPFVCGTDKVKDHQNNEYNTVQIGEQCWMKENMRCTTSPTTGTLILETSASGTSYTGKKAYYVNGNPDNTLFYGLLYNWNAAVDTFNTAYGETSTNSNSSYTVSVIFSGYRRGICPEGWHVPSDAEWTQLTDYVNSQEQYRCNGTNGYIAKALASPTGWSVNSSSCGVGNSSTNNLTGFTAVPAGFYNGSFNHFGIGVDLFSVTQRENISSKVWRWYMFTQSNSAGVSRVYDLYKNQGSSVRCLKDTTSSGGDTPCIGTHNVETESSCGNYTWHGQTYSESGTYTYAYTNNDGCASVDTLKLTVNLPVASTSSATACESYTWNGQTYTQSGDYTQTFTAANGCDSVVTLHLTIYQPVVTTSSATACESYSWNGTTYTQSGDYTQTFTAANGCDSVVTLHLTIYQPVNTTSSATACESYTWHGQIYTQNGDYTYNYTNEQGCPCTETLNLTINHGSHNVFTETAEGSYTWHEQTYTTSGTYIYTYNNENDCPSVDTLHLTVSSVTPIIPTDTVEDGQPCPGTPTVADHEGNVYNTVQIGTQCWTKENMRCTTSPKGYLTAGDTLSYSVPYYFDDSTSTIPLADRGLLYNWVGALDTTANANYSLKNRRGICPAGWHVPQDGEWGTLVRYVSSQSNYLCNNNTSNIGKALASTQYWTETTNSNQYCFVGYNQSANNATGFSAVPAGCFNGSEFVNSGIYAQFCSSSSGMTKYLWSRKIINNEREVTRIYSTSKRLGLSVRCLKDTASSGGDTPCIGTHNVKTESSCEAYTWHGQTYSESGTYTYAYTNEYGCPCTETLNLTINHGSHNVFTETAEGSYTWHEQTYTESGTYTYTYTNASGCASVDTLHLTVTSNSPTPPTPPSDTIADGYPCPNAHTVTDHEGNVYNTVQIGNQCWTKENMRCTTSPSTGTTILEVYPNGTSYTGKKAYYVNGNSYNTPSYGLLYNWNAAVDTFNTAYGETSTNSNSSNAVSVAFTSHRRGICPQGWHVPSDAEWTQLINYVSSKSRYQCGSTGESIAKALADTTGWNIYSIPCTMGNDLSANNATGFSALPAGAYFGSFYYFGDAADFWSTTSIYSYSAYYNYLYYDYAGVHQDLGNIYCGISVRCLMDAAIGGDTPCIGIYNVETENACENYTWHGQTYTQSGTYTYAYTNDGGCASVDTLFLTIYNGTHNTYTESAEGSYTWHGQTYTQSGTYTYSYTNDNGCPSMDTLFLTIFSNTPVLPIILVEDSLSCPGVPRVADHEGNIYNTVKIGNQCWTKENMRCTTSPSTGSSLLSEYSTAASKSASWHSSNTSYDSAYGLLYNWCAAVDTFLVTGGAPEVANATSSLKLYSTFNGYRRGICPIGWHVPSEQEWLQLLTYVYNQGFLCDDCDDPYLEDYNVSCIAKAMSSTTGWNTDNDECAVGYNMLSNNATGFNALPAGRYASGNYSSFGNYTYFWSSTEDYDRYSTWAYYTNWGYYYSNVERGETPKASKFSVRCVKDTISSHGGGDCIGSHNEESGSACDSYNWRGGTYTESGKYVYAYVNAQGCPCADTLHLVIHKPTTTTNSAAACESYDWHGQTLTASGTYTHNYENEFGCASTETLNLTIYHGTHDIFSAEDCESYTWHGTPYSASGIYTYAYTNEHGCPSMDTLYLAIQDHVNLTTAAGACEEYNWRGQTLTASGSYTADFTNDHGCSCTETLNLTIYHGTGTTYTETTCTRYLWHNEIYTQNGEYTYAYSDEHGCPCVDTLRLTIGNPCAGTPTVTDHQGNVYNTVQIGSQCWTKENMRCTTSPTTGTLLLNMDHPDTLTYSGKMAYYVNHDPSTAATYGLLYNWNAAVDVWNQDYSETHISWWPDSAVNITFSGHRRGICPQGWHVPSDAEWAQMINYVKSQSEYVCGNSSDNIAKALAIDTGWVTSTIYEDLGQGYYDLLDSFGVQVGGDCAVCNNQSSNNATCFSALPAGYYYGTDNIWNATGFDPNSSANFFSSTQMYQDDPNVDSSFSNMYIANAYGYGIFHFGRNVVRSATTKRYGNSVRCVKDSYSANGDVGYMDTNDAEIGKARKTNTPNEQTHTASSMGFRENPSEEPTEHIM